MSDSWSAGQWRKKLGLGTGVALLVVAAVVGTVALGLLNDGIAVRRGGGTPSSPAPTEDAYGPIFPIVMRLSADLSTGRSDLYVPRAESARRAPERYPVVLLATDPGTAPGQYELFAHAVAAYGFAVVVSDVPPQDLVEDVRAWSADLEADPSQYLHGLIGPEVVGVVAHGARRVPDELRSGLSAAVQVTPTAAVAAADGGADLLVVCGSRDPFACDKVPSGVARVTVAGADLSSVTDEGIRGPRESITVDMRRIPLIERLAQPTGLWLRARTGDPVAQRYFAAAVTAPPSAASPTPVG